MGRDLVGGLAAVNSSAIRFQDVTVAYQRHPAVHHVSGVLLPGSLTAVAGPNGAGKSTLLRALMGELPLAEGNIDRGGLSIQDIAYLPQAAEIDRSFPLNVAETVLLGAWRRIGAFRGMDKASADKARAAMEAVGLSGFERRSISSLSAGQFQRVLFARLLIQDAPVILLDEPFTAIDTRTTRDLLDIVGQWHGDGRTVVAVLHDFEQVRAHFPDTLLLARDAVGWGSTQEVLSPANLLRARVMAERWDEEAPACEMNGATRR